MVNSSEYTFASESTKLNPLRVEYLAIVDGADGFCADVTALGHLLQSDRRLSLDENTITFDGKDFVCDLQPGVTEDQTNRFFHIVIICNDIDRREAFEGLLKTLRGLLYKLANREPQILWDDVGRFYAMKAYPLIHELENLLRKLITKFMLTKVGLGWTKEAVPKEVSESVKMKSLSSGSTYLHQVDFIQLSHFLFKPYTTGDSKRILDELGKSKDLSDLVLSEIKQLIPRSNWDRYFSTVVKCESEFIRIRWERLYELRNHVAHNRSLRRDDFQDIESLVGEIRPVIENALAGVGDIVLSASEKETVAENVAISRHSLNGEYIELWNRAHEKLFALAMLVSNPENQERTQRLGKSPASLLNILSAEGAISGRIRAQLKECYRLRNVIVHHSDVTFPESKLHREISKLRSLLDVIELQIERGGAPYTIDDFRFSLDGSESLGIKNKKSNEDEPSDTPESLVDHNF
jgi:hypothetical protein